MKKTLFNVGLYSATLLSLLFSSSCVNESEITPKQSTSFNVEVSKGIGELGPTQVQMPIPPEYLQNNYWGAVSQPGGKYSIIESVMTFSKDSVFLSDYTGKISGTWTLHTGTPTMQMLTLTFPKSYNGVSAKVGILITKASSPYTGLLFQTHSKQGFSVFGMGSTPLVNPAATLENKTFMAQGFSGYKFSFGSEADSSFNAITPAGSVSGRYYYEDGSRTYLRIAFDHGGHGFAFVQSPTAAPRLWAELEGSGTVRAFSLLLTTNQ